jgi:flavin reductase (DIM6/NTAB) family NADH-FMN oxidoreductase RutF
MSHRAFDTEPNVMNQSTTMPAEAIEIPELLRKVMAGVPTPVSVVTAIDDDRPSGTTVSAFASLSMQPPMVMVALNEDSELLKMIRRTGRFGLNILGASQADLAMKFGRKGPDKCAGVDWNLEHGVPRLGGAPGWLACTTASIVAGGDHSVIMGLVVGGDSSGDDPLTYRARTFGTHVPHGTSA